MKKKFLAVALAAAFCLGCLTACGDKTDDKADSTTEATEEVTTEAEPTTEEISYDDGAIKVTAQIPAGSDYQFTDTQPDNMKMTGSIYLKSSKIVAKISTNTVFSDEKTFDGMIKFISADDYTGTIENFEQIKFGDRDAIKYEYRYGDGSGDLYGYWYYIDFPELYDGCMLDMVIATADGNSASTESVFADEEVKAVIDSLTFAPSSGEETAAATEEDAEEAPEEAPEEATEPANGGELSDNDVTVVVSSDTSKGTWYVDPTSSTVYFYNVASKDDAYSNSPRIQVSLADQDSYDYYAEMQENVVDIDNKTIGGVDLQGKTYSYVGMEWTEYYGKISGDEYVRIQISDVDIADGTDGANVLDNMTLEVK